MATKQQLNSWLSSNRAFSEFTERHRFIDVCGTMERQKRAGMGQIVAQWRPNRQSHDSSTIGNLMIGKSNDRRVLGIGPANQI